MSTAPDLSNDKAKIAVSWKFDQRIASDPNNCALIIEVLLDQLLEYDWGPKDTFAIHMAMEEAIMNAICHGNEKCADKQVHIVMTMDHEVFFARVTDEGCGFNLDEVPDPTDDENLMNTSGRGVALIRHFVDSVAYNDVGNSVELKKGKSLS